MAKWFLAALITASILIFQVLAECDFPDEITNAKLRYERKGDVNLREAQENYVLRFQCKRGFRRSGAYRSVCISGEWIPPPPFCIKIRCSKPPAIPNASYTVRKGTSSQAFLGSEVIYSCNKGYEMIDGDEVLKCGVIENIPQWIGTLPNCTEKDSCLDPGVSRTGSREGDCCYSGDTLRFQCHNDTQLAGEEEIRCLPGGRWSSPRPRCEPLDFHCDDPPEIANGSVTWELRSKSGDYFIPYEEVSVVCNPGFSVAEGSDFLSCGDDGWDDTFATCEASTCGMPDIPENGLIAELESTNSTSFPYEFEITYECDPGFRLIGNSWRICDSLGWSGKSPYCEAIQCPNPGNLEHGRKIRNFEMEGNFEMGEKVIFECDSGFTLIGSSERYCLPNGQWSGEVARCDNARNDCLNPGTPINGKRSTDTVTYKFGNTVKFSCSSGFSLVGSENRTCQEDGTWSGTEARCLGPYDFDTTYEVRQRLQQTLHEKIEEQERDTENYMKSFFDITLLNRPDFDYRKEFLKLKDQQAINLNFPGRLIFYFIFDSSGSVGKNNFETSIDFAKAFVQKAPTEDSDANEKDTFYSQLQDILNSVKKGDISLVLGGFNAKVGADSDLWAGVLGPFGIGSSNGNGECLLQVKVTPQGARFGALTFSSDATVEFLPVTYDKTEDVLNALDNLQFKSGGTDTSAALKNVREEMIPLTHEMYGKTNVKSIVFVLTDGRTNMGGNPQEEAKKLKEAGGEIYCIGITGNIMKDSLYKIASEPHGEHVFILNTYKSLVRLIEDIVNGTVDYSQCGLGLERMAGKKRVKRDSASARIIGGNKVIEPWPWMAAIYVHNHKIKGSEQELKCGGSIIREKWILTAAHCLFEKIGKRSDTRDLIVKLGLVNEENVTKSVKAYGIDEFVIHEEYDPFTLDYDIALLKLSRNIEFSAIVTPICLPPADLPNDTSLYKPKEYGFVAGWGYDKERKEGEASNTVSHLKELKLKIRSKKTCKDSLKERKEKNYLFTERMFCVGSGLGEVDTCKGDSGGPLMQSQLHNEGYVYWVQVGVVSWGIGCGQMHTYGFYTHVHYFLNWIQQSIY